MKAKVVGFRVLVMLAGFSLMQGCTTGNCPVRWLNWPGTTPKDQPVVFPAGTNTADSGVSSAVGFDSAVSPVSPVSSASVHLVKKGETLSSIASSYGTSWKNLAEHNSLTDPNNLKVGQEIRIPGSKNSAPSVTKRAPVSSRPIPSSIKQGSSYTVKKGDSVASIAKRSGLTVNEIKLANGLKNDSLSVGKTLSIPKKGAAVKAAAPAKSTSKAAAAATPAASSTLPAPAPISETAPAASAVSAPAAGAAAPAIAVPSAAPAAASSANAPVYEHVLYPGETLDDVARQYGSSQQEIMKLNKITDPSSVKPGTKLLVPIPE
ncbi:MAG: LysM peptidoglycan-binding domain-containing protein [Verrucomicrobia bacterium]|nr:LysM peptidoglycan-binding domain-containing protein [Verrucomicrobiota bacterium]